jgi:FAD/FMN-containing dehydrogenase
MSESQGLNCPANLEALTALFVGAQKNNTGIVIGAPRRVPPAARVKAVEYADLSSFKNVLEYSVPDQVIHVEAGITIGELRKLLAANKQWWPVFLPDDWTLFEAINTGESGAVEHRFSTVRDLVLGCDVLTGNGTVIKCGGRVVKNVTGYDMTKLFVGSRGALGAVLSAQLRLYALPEYSTSLRWDFNSFAKAKELSRKLVKSGLPLSAVTILATGVRGSWAVIAHAQGIQDVVEEVVESARALDTAECGRLEGAAVEELWKLMTDQFCARDDDQMIRIVAPGTVLSQIAERLPAFGAVEIRPFTGRVTIRSQDAEGVLSLFSRHTDELAPVVVAAADDRYNYRIYRFPSPGKAQAELQSRLKLQFDPAGILNPFVAI